VRTIKRKVFYLLGGAALAAGYVPAASAGSWQNYYGTGTMHAGLGSNVGTSGYNSWTGNRVYRPTGNNFHLDYDDGSYHYSGDNSTTQPFSWEPYGYSYIGCIWDPTSQEVSSSAPLSPVTCQGYA
jgi:hypothetical protein